MLKILGLGLGKLVSSVHGREFFPMKKKMQNCTYWAYYCLSYRVACSYSQEFVKFVFILRKMLSVKQKFDRKTIYLSQEAILTNNKNFTTKKFATEKSTKTRFFLVFPLPLNRQILTLII
jgi:hypothetical protein